ncbi:hypothetical protein BH10PSE19_BH10PSE19_02620 [soil metagenome]
MQINLNICSISMLKRTTLIGAAVVAVVAHMVSVANPEPPKVQPAATTQGIVPFITKTFTKTFSSRSTPAPTVVPTVAGFDVNQELRLLAPKAPNLDKKVLRLALEAYAQVHHKHLDKRPILTVINYQLASKEPRFWVFDLKHGTLLFNTLVAHGSGSGSRVRAEHFSNRPGGKASSLGVFITGDTYKGHCGYSLRLHGLERGVNDKAFSRAVVVHGAWYVNKAVAKQYGQIGRSSGCPAVGTEVVVPIINTIKNGSVVFSYYPESSWLTRSAFLHNSNKKTA